MFVLEGDVKMKQVFICEICGETFDSARDASDCEHSHWSFNPDKLDGIEAQAYNPNYDSIMYLVVPCRRVCRKRIGVKLIYEW